MVKLNRKLLSARYRLGPRAGDPEIKDSRELLAEISDLLRTTPGARLVHECCPLCGAESALLISEKAGNGLPLPVQICDDCGLVYAGHFFSDDFAGTYYSKYYNRFKNKNLSPADLFAKRTAPEAYCWKRQTFIREVLGARYNEIRRVMEPGCNDGCNLYPYLRDGLAVVGSDFDDFRMDAGRAVGINIHRGGPAVLLEKETPADLLIFSHFLAHVVDVNAVLEISRGLLRPGGFLYIETPGLRMNRIAADPLRVDGHSSGNDFLGFYQFEFNYVFDLETLRLFLGRHGFQLVAGDEVIRSLFVRSNEAGAPVLPIKRGRQVWDYLRKVEDDFAGPRLPIWKIAWGFVRKVLRRLINSVKRPGNGISLVRNV